MTSHISAAFTTHRGTFAGHLGRFIKSGWARTTFICAAVVALYVVGLGLARDIGRVNGAYAATHNMGAVQPEALDALQGTAYAAYLVAGLLTVAATAIHAYNHRSGKRTWHSTLDRAAATGLVIAVGAVSVTLALSFAGVVYITYVS